MFYCDALLYVLLWRFIVCFTVALYCMFYCDALLYVLLWRCIVCFTVALY
jgi:hypothetical protein